MKLFYVANARFPTERAHGIQIISMCQAFVQAGCDVTLVIPNRRDSKPEMIGPFYGIEPKFDVMKLPCIDTFPLMADRMSRVINKILYSIQSLSYAIQLIGLPKDVVYYVRDDFTAAILKATGRFVVRELHALFGKRLFHRRTLHRADGIVTITRSLRDDIVQQYGIDEQKIVVEPDAVNLDKFETSMTKNAARKQLGLDRKAEIVVYTGHLYEWKGADILAKAAMMVPEAQFIFVGGREQDIREFKRQYSADNIRTLGFKPHEQMPLYLKAADLVALPNSGKQEISRKHTSPMKLFEYMASGRPIVASDLPSIREILDEQMAFFAEPDNPKALANTIKEALSNKKKGAQISLQALKEVKAYDWSARAERIVSFIESKRKE